MIDKSAYCAVSIRNTTSFKWLNDGKITRPIIQGLQTDKVRIGFKNTINVIPFSFIYILVLFDLARINFTTLYFVLTT